MEPGHYTLAVRGMPLHKPRGANAPPSLEHRREEEETEMDRGQQQQVGVWRVVRPHEQAWLREGKMDREPQQQVGVRWRVISPPRLSHGQEQMGVWWRRSIPHQSWLSPSQAEEELMHRGPQVHFIYRGLY